MKKNIKLGFTLAEVLITLTIIGVVAAVTVPTLNKKTGNQEIVTKLQKVYSVLSQATDEIILEKGSPKNNWGTPTNTVYESYRKYLRNAKECSYNAGCFTEFNSEEGYKTLSGNKRTDNWENSKYSNLILADGTAVMFLSKSAGCTSNSVNYGSTNICSEIHVDLNGSKKPNQYGRDVFTFVLKQDGLYPAGCDDDTKNDCITSSGNGYGCSCKIITEGEMNY